MNISILTSTQLETWQSYFRNLPDACADVYFSPYYYNIFEKLGHGNAFCFVLEEMGKYMLYPFLKKPIRPLGHIDTLLEFYDIEGAYGYNGVASNCNDPDFINSFGVRFCEYAKSENIIAEFTRFNPVNKNQIFSPYMQIVHANNNVVLDLTGKNIWMDDYEHSTRKNVGKAQRNGCCVVYFPGNTVPDKFFDSFLAIYNDTMTRNNVDDFYFFPRSFFDMLRTDLDQSTLFFFTCKDSIPISAEIVLHNNTTAYSFLGGTLTEYFPFRPNDILKHNIVQTLRERGIHHFCLGGGVTMNDGIFKYKRTFAKNGVTDFFIGKKIHNGVVYDSLVDKWEHKYPDKANKYKNFLLKYRM